MNSELCNILVRVGTNQQINEIHNAYRSVSVYELFERPSYSTTRWFYTVKDVPFITKWKTFKYVQKPVFINVTKTTLLANYGQKLK